jgi:hypothetical protein
MPKKEKVTMGISYPDGSPVMSGDLLKVEGIPVPVTARAYYKPDDGTKRTYTYWNHGPKNMGVKTLSRRGFDRWTGEIIRREVKAKPASETRTEGKYIVALIDYDHVEVR